MIKLGDMIPQVTFTNNGCEIRNKTIPDVFFNEFWKDYYSRWGRLEVKVKKEDDDIVTTFNNVPVINDEKEKNKQTSGYPESIFPVKFPTDNMLNYFNQFNLKNNLTD